MRPPRRSTSTRWGGSLRNRRQVGLILQPEGASLSGKWSGRFIVASFCPFRLSSFSCEETGNSGLPYAIGVVPLRGRPSATQFKAVKASGHRPGTSQ